jgi:DNA primase
LPVNTLFKPPSEYPAVSIPQSFIQDLIARADVTEVVGRHVQLKKAGANFLGLCPFHGEKSPSFTVSPVKQFFHCFGCGKSGNAIGFLMEHTGASFVDAVHDLASTVGMVVPADERSPQDRERAAQAKQVQASLNTVLEKAVPLYRQQLKSSPRAIDYLKRRGVSGDVAKAFGLGYAAEGWHNLSQHYATSEEALLIEAGMMIEREADSPDAQAKRYDRFRDRIMFPIRNVKGECIGFGGRILDQGEPKYLNSPETPVFSKGRELYGLFEARTALREHGFALVTEGYMDVVALAQLGFANAVATLGTACTNEHVQKLFRFTDAVVFSFDGDKAGRRAALRALEASLPFASDTRSVKFLYLPPEHDPDSFIREHGKEAFSSFIAQALPLSRLLLDTAREGCDLNSIEGRSLLASQAKPLIQALPQGALRLQLLQELGELTELGVHNLNALWDGQDQLKAQRSAGHARRQGGATPAGGYGNAYALDAASHSNAEPAGLWHGDTFDGHGGWKKRGDWSANGTGANGFNAGKGVGKTGAYTGSQAGFRAHFKKTADYDRSPRASRSAPATSADHAVRLLLGSSAAWEGLSAQDHQILADLPGDHGALFRWLEAQMNEHGAQPWASLREGLSDQPFKDLAERRMSPQSVHNVVEALAPEPAEDGQEGLNSAMKALRRDWFLAQEKLALEAGQMQRYLELQGLRRGL